MKKNTIERGDIYSYYFSVNNGSVQGGLRPALVLQNNKQNADSTTTIVVPITKVIKKTHLMSHFILGKRFGLRENSMVLLEQIRTVNQDKLCSYIGHIDDPYVMNRIDQKLCKTLGITLQDKCKE